MNKEILNWINAVLLKNKTALISIRARDKFLKNNYPDNYNTIIELTSFLDKNVKVSERIYCIVNNIKNIITCSNKDCNNKVSFVKFAMGYRKYCCKKCLKDDIEFINIKMINSYKKTCLDKYGVDFALKSDIVKNKIKKTCLEKYGVDNVSKSDIIKNKRKKTCLDKYGVDHFLKSDIARSKIKQIMIEKHGVNNAFESKEVRNKIKQTFLEKYGVENVYQSDIIKDKIKQTMIEKYGVDNISKSNIIKDKIKNICLDKYGVDCVLKSDIIKNKIKNTMIEKYGVDHFSKSDIFKNKIKQTFLKKYGVDHFSQINLLNNDMLNKVYDKKWLKYHHHELKKPCSNISKEFNLNRNSIAYFMHKNNVNVINRYFSYSEKEIVGFINSDDIETNTRKIIHPYELDIYIPEYKLAIEFNGLYWHSKHNKNYHLNKTELCLKKDIQLLHIFENEWINTVTQDIWKSIINNKLGRNNRIFARKTEIREITNNKIVKEFLDNNHLQGYCQSSVKLGLFYNNELVSFMTFGKTRFSKKYEWEMIRFCNKKFTNVIGGASKLYKYFINNYKPKSVISYADRRYSNGNLYKHLGFEFSHFSKPNYWYFINHTYDLYPRIKFQKHKLFNLLENFDNNKSEIENMLENGYLRIFDCGNIVLTYF